MTITRYTQNDIRNLNKNKIDKSDWKRVKNQKDSAIKQAALSDKDAPLISDSDAVKFKPRNKMKNKLGLT